jgi:S1-C subfamily serine protease
VRYFLRLSFRMRNSALSILVLLWARPLVADEASVAAASKLIPITVTVRMSSCETPGTDQEKTTGGAALGPAAIGATRTGSSREDSSSGSLPVSGAKDKSNGDKSSERPDCVTVCTGITIGRGLVVTSLSPTLSAKFRITLPGGRRASAQPRVIDHYSGLLLLAVEKMDVAGAALADKSPPIGSSVYSAAAWGSENPTFSQGMVSAVDRTLPGTNLPPLLQLDLRTAPTSGGAAVIDGEHRLQGIIVAHEVGTERVAWAYAVPASHLTRLMKAHQDDKLVTLERRRAVAGIRLDRQRDRVVVRRLEKESPAALAGLREGAQILEVEGVRIRSPLEVYKAILARQPGDLLQILVRQADHDGNDADKKLAIKLGDGTGPPVRVAPLGEPQVSVKIRGQNVEVQPRPPADQTQLLPEAVKRYLALIDTQRRAIVELHDELRSRDSKIDRMRAELTELKRLVAEKFAANPGSAPAPPSSSGGGTP